MLECRLAGLGNLLLRELELPELQVGAGAGFIDGGASEAGGPKIGKSCIGHGEGV